MLKNIFELADGMQTNIAGMLTWAFEFEDQPYFDGFRTLATNGIDKPVLNVFRMAGLMNGQRVNVESSGRIPLKTMASDGVRGASDIDALATRSDRHVSVMLWNYQDDDVSGEAVSVALRISGLPSDKSKILLQHFRIDQNHSNAYRVWKRQGSPVKPTAEQYMQLEAAGGLELLESPKWIECREGTAEIHFALPLQATSLIDLSWP
jgi:xylan 1,4-beta-xylosidase